MNLLLWLSLLSVGGAPSAIVIAPPGQDTSTEELAYLSWNEKQCMEIGAAMRATGRVGGFFDTRIVGTNKSYNYKLRATWLTPEVIRAAARLRQFEQGLTNEETVALVAKAESLGDTIVMVEIDPREGSGVIPREWIALLRPKTSSGESIAVRGVNHPELRNVRVLSGTQVRDYSYDVFWLSFSLLDAEGRPLLLDTIQEAELVVRIYSKEGRVSWAVPASIRDRATEIVNSGGGGRSGSLSEGTSAPKPEN